jgi:hypothetical protein
LAASCAIITNRDKDWSKVYHEAGRTTFDNEGGGDGGRSFYLAFYKIAIERAIAPNAAWYCWHASARQAMLEDVWNEVGAFNHQQVIWFKSRPVLNLQRLYVGARAVSLRVDQRPEASRRPQVWQSRDHMAGAERRG